MKLAEIDPELGLPPFPPKEDNWIKKETEFDSIGIGDLSDGTTLSKFAMTTKLFNFMDNTTMHGIRYIFMRNISQSKRCSVHGSD